MKKRHVELYVGEGGDSGTWWTEYVEIPVDTPDDKIEEVAIDTFKTEDTAGGFVFCGVYAIPDLDDDINCDDEDE